jgi:hypothetical protein
MTALLSLCLCFTAAEPAERPCVLIVVGTPGEPEYEAEFARWAGLWEAEAAKGGAEAIRIGGSDENGTPDRERLRALLEERASGTEPLWLVLIGHGTWDGRTAKFNLRGPDVSADELAAWLKPVTRPVAVIDCSSASGPLLNRLSAANRVVVTATRSGDESNYARFGGFLAEAIADPSADLDKDGQTSLLEAYLTAGGRTEEWYKSQSRLATEHALLDDNGDGLGTPAGWFRGVRATKRAKDGAALDGVRAHQMHLVPGDRERELSPEVRRRRDEIERQVAALREEKATLGEEEYYRRLEPLMVELARLYAGAKPPGE